MKVSEIIHINDYNENVTVAEVINNYDDNKKKIKVKNKNNFLENYFANIYENINSEEKYSQGARQIYSVACQDNASAEVSFTSDFYMPATIKKINKIVCIVDIQPFRANNQELFSAIINKTSSAASEGIASTTTQDITSTESAPQKTISSQEGALSGMTSVVASSNLESVTGREINLMPPEQLPADKINYLGHTHKCFIVGVAGQNNDHRHPFQTSPHSHLVSSPAHTHKTKDHAHGFFIKPHQHFLDYSHKHNLEPFVKKYAQTQLFNVYLNDCFIMHGSGIQFFTLLLNLIKPGYNKLDVRPYDLAHVCVTIYIDCFIQSHEGGLYHAT